ncbi:MAG: hypothetical protein HY881_26500 [Deltaproteobacteria bacterium]|nr:hypothetical protein [Deltaproteobacteria bacterium]
MNILIFGNCITERCLQYRKNQDYLSVAGRKKVLALSKAIEGLGHAVDICSISYSKHTHSVFIEQLSKKSRLIHAPTIGLKGKLSFFKRTIGAIFNIFWLILHFRSYDAIIFWNYHIEFSLPALMGKWMFGIKAIMDYEDGLFLDKGYRGAIYRFWEKTVYHHSSGFILVNERLRFRLDQYISTEKPSVTVHGFVDGDLLKRYKNLEKGTVKRIVFSGNFSTGFGFQELLGYVDYLPDDILFDITGKASKKEENELKNHIEHRINIHYHGFVDDNKFSEIVEKADAFVLLNDPMSPYTQTNFPSKFFDYLSRNKFILTTRNSLLTPYCHLKNVVLLNSFPSSIKQLHEMTEARKTDYQEIMALELDTVRRLNEFFKLLDICDNNKANG